MRSTHPRAAVTLCVSVRCHEHDDCARFVSKTQLETTPIADWHSVIDALLDVPIGHHCPLRIPHTDRAARL